MEESKIIFDHKINNDQPTIKPKALKGALDSITSFFSIAYGIILATSISYNAGYFKYINPQLAELLSLEDYINDTIHNVWLFLLGSVLFFSGSLAFVKKRLSGEMGPIIVFGLFTLIVSFSLFLKGINYSKFWPTIKTLAVNTQFLLLFTAVCFLSIMLITFIVYRLTFKIIKDEMPIYSVSLMPIIIFLIVIFTPYLVGIIEAHIERTYLTKDQYNTQTIDIYTIAKQEKLGDLLIIKKMDKGLIVRQFSANQSNDFFFINWGDIQKIMYKDIPLVSLLNTTN